MSWTYHQSTGELLQPSGISAGFGFAGHGQGLNNPLAEDQHGVGPLPQGLYYTAEWIQSHDTMGLCVIRLDPDPANVMFGRCGFFIHGAVSLEARGLRAFLSSSDGCICYRDCGARSALWHSGDRRLQVIP